jgi:hypothetical protein
MSRMKNRWSMLLVVVAFSCGASAQKPKPKPESEDISQKLQGTVTIRNGDSSVRPVPFVNVRIYETERDGLTDLLGAWKSVQIKAVKESKGLSQFPLTCQEVMSAGMAGNLLSATYANAQKSGKWDEVKEQGLALYSSFYTDKDGNFEYDVGIPSSSTVCLRPEGCDMTASRIPKYKEGETIVSPPMNTYGPFLLIALLDTPTTWYYWEEQIKIREGEKTPPVVLTNPIVCTLTEGAK